MATSAAKALIVLVLLLAIAPSTRVAPAQSPEDIPSPRSIVKGPMLQNVSSNSVTVVWTTDSPVTGYLNFSRDLSFSSSVSDPAPSVFHELTAAGLEDGTTYNYRVEGAGRSADSTFTTAPAAGPSHFRFAAYGDTRTDNNAHAAVFNRMISYDPEFILNVGDLVTSGASVSDWNGFFGVIGTGANDSGYWPSVGNHDYPLPYYFQNFSLPGNERYYSFDYCSVHIIALEVTTTPSYGNGTPQNDWLRGDLEAHKSSEWKFVFFHNPLYSSGSHGSDTNARAVLDPLFVKYGVDMVFSGHDHDYEHASPGNGIHYFVTGGGGAPLSPVGQNSWTVYSESTYEFMVLDVEDNITRVRTIRPDNTSVENVTIFHPDRRAPPPVNLSAEDTRIGGEVFVNWSGYDEAPEPDLYQYKLFVSNSSFTNVSGMPPHSTFQKGNRTATVGNLTDNSAYFFAVVALDTSVNANMTVTAASATPTDRTPPAPPSGLHVTAPGYQTVNLSWNASTEKDLSGYRVFINSSGAGPLVFLGNAGKSTSYQAGNLSMNTTYAFALDAIDSAVPAPNNSSPCQPVCATTLQSPSNRPPVMVNPLANITIDEDAAPFEIVYLSVFSDPDGDALNHTVGLSAGLKTFGSTAPGRVSVAPVRDWNGPGWVLITATDGRYGVAANVSVTVRPVNDPPVLVARVPENDVEISETQAIDFSVSVSDVDTPVISYQWYLDGKRAGDIEMTYTLVTGYNSSGDHAVRVVVGDGQYDVSSDWKIVVENRNRAPENVTIDAPGKGYTAMAGHNLTFSGSARDPDGDVISYAWYDGGDIIGSGQLLEMALPAGTHELVLECSDGQSKTRSEGLSVTVLPNRKPVLTVEPAGTTYKIQKGKSIELRATGTDPDNDTLSFIWSEGNTELARGQVFNTSTLAVGTHLIIVSVSDNHNEPSTEVSLTVVITRPPSPSGDNFSAILLTVVVVAVIVVVAGDLLLRHQTKK